MIRPWRGLDTAFPPVIISSSISYDGTGGCSSFARSQFHRPTASLHIWLLLAITALFFSITTFSWRVTTVLFVPAIFERMNGRAIDFRNIGQRAEMSTHVRVCSTTHHRSYVPIMDGVCQLPTALHVRPPCQFPIPVLPDLVSLSLHQCTHFSRSLHHI
jgi:hypothetical protein